MGRTATTRAGYLRETSAGRARAHRAATLGRAAGALGATALLVAASWCVSGSWPAGVPQPPPLPFPVPPAVVPGLAAVVGLAVVATLLAARRWRTHHRIARLAADPRLATVLPPVRTVPVGPFAPPQPAPVVAAGRIPGRFGRGHRVTRERNAAGLPALQIVYLQVVESRSRTRAVVRGAWREFGYVHLLRSAASVAPGEFRRHARDGRLSELVVGSEGAFRARLAHIHPEPLAPGWHRVHAGTAVPTYDRYGAYPVSAPVCAGAFWTRALDILLERADLVVLDLAGVREGHGEGTQLELQRVVDTVPVGKVLLLTDPGSGTRLLTDQVRSAWSRMAARSPNVGRGPLAVRGAVVDHVRRADVEASRSSRSRSSRSSLPSRSPLSPSLSPSPPLSAFPGAGRRQTRWLLRDVQRGLAAARPVRVRGTAVAPPHLPPHVPAHLARPAAVRSGPVRGGAPRWPWVSAVLLAAAMALLGLYQVVGGGG